MHNYADISVHYGNLWPYWFSTNNKMQSTKEILAELINKVRLNEEVYLACCSFSKLILSASIAFSFIHLST